MSYIQNFQHIVISTKSRQMTLNRNSIDKLYNYISGFLQNKDCKLIAIGGIEDHIHILTNFNPQLSLSQEIGNLKRSASLWIKQSGYFPLFNGWAKEYGSFSVSYGHIEAVSNYIKSQQSHHANLNSEDEYKRLILKNGLVYYQYPEE
ncbi:MAG: transposase [Muribaculaceae bacterium]|nr:transposase [Muribaculaceae bacterium]MDE7092031.1 transposase [Muribaculaceae bacterium]